MLAKPALPLLTYNAPPPLKWRYCLFGFPSAPPSPPAPPASRLSAGPVLRLLPPGTTTERLLALLETGKDGEARSSLLHSLRRNSRLPGTGTTQPPLPPGPSSDTARVFLPGQVQSFAVQSAWWMQQEERASSRAPVSVPPPPRARPCPERKMHAILAKQAKKAGVCRKQTSPADSSKLNETQAFQKIAARQNGYPVLREVRAGQEPLGA